MLLETVTQQGVNRTVHLSGGSCLPLPQHRWRVCSRTCPSSSGPHLSIIASLDAICVAPVSASLPRRADLQWGGKDWATKRFIILFSIKHMLNMVTLKDHERGDSFCSPTPSAPECQRTGARLGKKHKCFCPSIHCLLLLAVERRSWRRLAVWADPARMVCGSLAAITCGAIFFDI